MLEIKNAVVVVVFIFFKHNGLIGDWQIQIIFTQRNQYRAQIFVHAQHCLCARYMHGCNHAHNLWRPEKGNNECCNVICFGWNLFTLQFSINSNSTVFHKLELLWFKKAMRNFWNSCWVKRYAFNSLRSPKFSRVVGEILEFSFILFVQSGQPFCRTGLYHWPVF